MNKFFNPSVSQDDNDNDNNQNNFFFRNNNPFNSNNIQSINPNLKTTMPTFSFPVSHQNSPSFESDNNESQCGQPFFRNNNNIFSNLPNNQGNFGVSFNNESMKEQKKIDEDFNNIFLPKTINTINNELNVQKNRTEIFPFDNPFNINSNNSFSNNNNIRNDSIFSGIFSKNMVNSCDYKIETLFGNNNKNKNISQNINIQNGCLFKPNKGLNNNPFSIIDNNKSYNPFERDNNETNNLFLITKEKSLNPIKDSIIFKFCDNENNKDEQEVNAKRDNYSFSYNLNPFLSLLNSNNHKSDNKFNQLYSNILSKNPIIQNSNEDKRNNENNLRDINNKKENNIFLNDNNNCPYELKNQRNSVFNSDESNRNNKKFQISSAFSLYFEKSPSYKNSLIYIKEYSNNNHKNLKVYKFEANSSDISLEKLIFDYLENNYVKKEEKKIKDNDKIELNCQIVEPQKLSFIVEIGKKDAISILKRKICEELKKGNDKYNKIEDNSFCLMKNFNFVDENENFCGNIFSDCDNAIIVLKEIMKKHL